MLPERLSARAEADAAGLGFRLLFHLLRIMPCVPIRPGDEDALQGQSGP